jgi:predicted RNase H-like HicB family nuclease
MVQHRQGIHREQLTVRYTDAGDGWVTAQIAEEPAAISQGRTREEAYANVIDALCDLRQAPTDRL